MTETPAEPKEPQVVRVVRKVKPRRCPEFVPSSNPRICFGCGKGREEH